MHEEAKLFINSSIIIFFSGHFFSPSSLGKLVFFLFNKKLNKNFAVDERLQNEKEKQVFDIASLVDNYIKYRKNQSAISRWTLQQYEKSFTANISRCTDYYRSHIFATNQNVSALDRIFKSQDSYFLAMTCILAGCAETSCWLNSWRCFDNFFSQFALIFWFDSGNFSFQ